MMDILLDNRPQPRLAEMDACLFGPGGVLQDEVPPSPDCLNMAEDCFDRLHLDPEAGFPDNEESLFLLARCAERESERFYVLNLRHAREVFEALEAQLGEEDRTLAYHRLVQEPEDAALGGIAGCMLRARGDRDKTTICAAIWRRDTVIRARRLWLEERP